MISNTKVLAFSILTLFSSLCYGQVRVYRADTRSPDQIKQIGAFAPRGLGSSGRVAPNTSMFNHANGAANFQSLEDDGYVSTTIDETTAENFLGNFFAGTGYVYTIAAAPNFIQVAGTLGQFNPFSDELEYAALGGFNWDQVIGWQQRNAGTQVGGFVTNPDYNGARYNSQRPSQGEPSLAGFPNGHRAWTLAPWNAFANGNCGPRRMRSRLAIRQANPPTNCGASQTNVAVATAFLDKNCPPQTCF